MEVCVFILQCVMYYRKNFSCKRDSQIKKIKKMLLFIKIRFTFLFRGLGLSVSGSLLDLSYILKLFGFVVVTLNRCTRRRI